MLKFVIPNFDHQSVAIEIFNMSLIKRFASNSGLASIFRHLYHRPWPPSPAKIPFLEDADVTEEAFIAWDCGRQFYPVRQGEVLNNRYQITTKASYGSSSTVWIARDLKQYVFTLFINSKFAFYRFLSLTETDIAGYLSDTWLSKLPPLIQD
jgi:hypothetical protein